MIPSEYEKLPGRPAPNLVTLWRAKRMAFDGYLIGFVWGTICGAGGASLLWWLLG